MNVLVAAIIPVMAIALVGFIAGKTLHLDRKTLSQLILYVLAPALIVSGIYRATLTPKSAVEMILGFTLTTLVLYILLLIVAKLFNLPPLLHSSLIATTLFSNSGNFALPVITLAFGDAGLERAIIYFICAAVLVFAIGPLLLQGQGLKTGLALIVKLPLFWGVLGGGLLRVFAVELPENIAQGFKLLGDAAIPLALLLLGMQLASTPMRVGGYEIIASGLRLLVAPAIAYLVGSVLGLTGLDLQVLVLEGGMPVAVNAFVMVTEFGGDSDRVARTVLLSTLLSLITLPLILGLIN